MSAQNNPSLLIELRTEELPPKSLHRLGEVFAAEIFNALSKQHLLDGDSGDSYTRFTTPRRLAVLIPNVLAEAPDLNAEEKLMPVSVAFDAKGGLTNPTPALLKKMEAKAIPASAISQFERRMDGKSETLFYNRLVRGAKLDDVLSAIVSAALNKLPIQKMMRWGDTDYQFVRPVHGLMMLHGARVVPGEILGLTSGKTTVGHRFLSTGAITIDQADHYAEKLLNEGCVIVDFAKRRAAISEQLAAKAAELNATLNPSGELLNEVTALVEWPVVYVAEFEREYLDVPPECLILTMQQHQKYFPLLAKNGERAGQLMNQFLIVSNMQVDDPKHIVTGNARVVRPRLADARFFFNQDRKEPLASRLEKLANVVYHNKLGSVLERVERLERLAGLIAAKLSNDKTVVLNAARAARLAKADLSTDMVGEFPELQGIMGRYYALHDGEDLVVADAIKSHYQPRFAGDDLPQGVIACAAALADKLDALTGFFGIGQIPTGDKDPFALRRASLGILRILIETAPPLALDLHELLMDAAQGFKPGLLALAENGVPAGIEDFIADRLRGLLRESIYEQEVIESVLSLNPTRIDLIPAKLNAVKEFLFLPEALALAAANKRIGNLLKKAEGSLPEPSETLLTEYAEKALYVRVNEISPRVKASLAEGDYTNALKAVAEARAEVDLFFEQVMVNVDDLAVRHNRLGLLKKLFEQLNAVADISKLSELLNAVANASKLSV